MRKILNVIPFVDNDGKRAIEVVYEDGREVVPFSEESLLKYRKQYEGKRYNKKEITKKVEIKNNIKHTDINIDKIADYIIENKEVILRRIKIFLVAAALIYGIKSCHDEFSNLPDVVLPDEEKEEVVTYDVSEYYANLDNKTKTK